MIIKSLGRKARTNAYGRRGGRGLSAFGALIRYMNRGIEEEEGRAVLWHNFRGGAELSEEELTRAFEDNARGLKDRKNGNVLYHEILSFSLGHALDKDRLARHIADVGQEYLRRRAPEQLAYGVIHLDTDHIHLHLMVSANRMRSFDRVRLAKADFAEIQRETERYLLARYPELAQTRIYDRADERERGDHEKAEGERVRMTAHEQNMHVHRGTRSKKLDLANALHQVFEKAKNFDELTKLLEVEGYRLYQRGKTPGVIVRDENGVEIKHRFSTLGLLPHYESTIERLAGRTPANPAPEKNRDERAKSEGKGREAMPNPKEVQRGINETVADVSAMRERRGEKQAAPKTQEVEVETKSRTREIIEEEVRFGKEVIKDFIFSPYREGRQPGNAAPPPETEKERRIRELKQARARAREKSRSKDRDDHER